MIPSLGQFVGRNSAAYCAGCFPALGRYTFGGIRPSAYSALRTLGHRVRERFAGAIEGRVKLLKFKSLRPLFPTTRTSGSPNTPLSFAAARNPGNEYSSHQVRARFIDVPFH